jgi:hypothetical protein
MYVIFKDLVSQDYYTISSYSIEYPDYETMTEMGKMKKVYQGSKKECNIKLEELQETV